MLEKAVRWVIIMIVLVFDPLAVLMLVAVNWSLKKSLPKVKEPPKQEGWHQEWIPDTEAWPEYKAILDEEPKEPPKKKRKPRKRTWLEPEPTPLPEAADWDEDRIDTVAQNGNDGLHYEEAINPDEYVSPAKTIEQEIDELNVPTNSLDRLNKKYPLE